jgi:hypothetical protein
LRVFFEGQVGLLYGPSGGVSGIPLRIFLAFDGLPYPALILRVFLAFVEGQVGLLYPALLI